MGPDLPDFCKDNPTWFFFNILGDTNKQSIKLVVIFHQHVCVLSNHMWESNFENMVKIKPPPSCYVSFFCVLFSLVLVCTLLIFFL